MKVLLAEDDDLARFMMSEMLDELGFDFDSCADGIECVDRVISEPNSYALVLMDIHMPNRTGIEAAQMIRAIQSDPPNNLPIIAVTADRNWQNPKRASEVGFTDVLPKPVSMNSLSAQLSRFLESNDKLT